MLKPVEEIRPTPRHMIMKFQNTKEIEKIYMLPEQDIVSLKKNKRNKVGYHHDFSMAKLSLTGSRIIPSKF